jgi:lysophospholipase L1-like esterase
MRKLTPSTSLQLAVIFATAVIATPVVAQNDQGWVSSWTGSVQGPYPVGNPSAQPDQRFAFPNPAIGANDQTFRLMVRPDLLSRQVRLRFSNAFGVKPLTLDGVFVGLQMGSAAIVPGTNERVRFGTVDNVVISPGRWVWSDPVTLPFVSETGASSFAERMLAVSFHVVGESGPMTWHAKALQTSYVTAPRAGARGAEEGEAAYRYSTTSWFFLDAVDVIAPAGTPVIVALGDSITDGTSSTMNGYDRWTDVLARRLHAAYGNRVSVVNAGIGGNQVVGPKTYGPDKPFPGGPSAVERLDRDVLGLSGVSTVIWLEGINDFGRNGNASVADVQAGMRAVVARLRARLPNVRVVGATITSALGSTNPLHGFEEQNVQRKALNDFIRTSDLFDAVLDFDAVTLDPDTGGLKREMIPESTTGGDGDKLHPNHAGYLAMGMSINLDAVAPSLVGPQ